MSQMVGSPSLGDSIVTTIAHPPRPSGVQRKRSLSEAGIQASSCMSGGLYGGFPKLGVPFWGSQLRNIVFWGLYWVPLFRETTICHLNLTLPKEPFSS